MKPPLNPTRSPPVAYLALSALICLILVPIAMETANGKKK